MIDGDDRIDYVMRLAPGDNERQVALMRTLLIDVAIGGSVEVLSRPKKRRLVKITPAAAAFGVMGARLVTLRSADGPHTTS